MSIYGADDAGDERQAKFRCALPSTPLSVVAPRLEQLAPAVHLRGSGFSTYTMM